MSSNRSSTTDKQNCPTLLKALSHFTAFGILSSTPQNHYQNKLTCCPLRMDWTRINEAHQRAALCSKSTGVNTHSSASGTSCGEVTQTGTLMYPVVEICTAGPPQQHRGCLQKTESLCCSQIHLAGSHP